jgi:hypothetical protein
MVKRSGKLSAMPANTAAPVQLLCMNARQQPSRLRSRISH